MRRLFGLLGVAISVVLLCTSCLKGNDDSELTTYNDMAITDFTLGTLNQYLHTLSSTGADSIYKQTVDGSVYRFSIDHLKREIYNPDSLPVGTDAAHIVSNISTYRGGVIYFESTQKQDSLILYSSADSIDFSQVRKARVYAYNSTGYSTYTIRVNVHKEDGDVFNWNRASTYSEEAQAVKDELEAYRAQAQTAGMKQYIGRSTTELYALSNENHLMVSEDNGKTWTEEMLDDDISLLPTANISSTYFLYSFYTDIDYVLMIGTRNSETYPNDKYMHMWHKIVDYSPTAQPSIWTYMEVTENNPHYLPLMQSPAIFKYADKLLCLGLKDDELMVYESNDGGITWKENTKVNIPDELQTVNPVSIIIDEDNYIWIEQPATGQLWRGRMNKQGWKR